MADLDKVPDSQMDTQGTCDATADEASQDEQPVDNSLLSESQDFKLVQEETDKLTQDENEETQSNDVLPDTIQTTSEDTERSNSPESVVTKVIEGESECRAEKRVSEQESLAPAAKENPSCTKSEEKKEQVETEEDDEDFVPGSQVETLSPLKKQISSLTGGISQKRKAESSEEAQAKFPRTCSQENALSEVRKQLDDEEDIFASELADETLEEEITTKVIIQETQESCTVEGNSESLQEVEQQLEEALSQQDENDANPKSADNEKSEKATSEKVHSSNVLHVTQKRKSPKGDVVEAEESSVTEAQAAEESSKSQVAKLEDVESTRTEKSAVTSEISEENSKKIDSDTISKEDSELNKDSLTIPTKDKEAEAVELNPAQKNDDSGINFQDTSNKAHTEIPPAIKLPSHKSRMSIEVIYDKATAPPEKKRPRELVEIDEDGEKIVLDSSQEGCDRSMEKSAIDNKIETSFKTCDSKSSTTDYKSVDTSKESSSDFAGYALTNGSAETKKSDSSDQTASPGSDILAAASHPIKLDSLTPGNIVRNTPKSLISISDSEGDSFVADERTKSQLEAANRQNVAIKVVEKELSILVKLKCSVHIDEITKEHVERVITCVHSESSAQDLSSTRRRNSDVSACLADISGNAGDNRDASPGSVTSNTQPYPLNARLSLASTISSSSASSAASMNAKFAANPQFQLPRIPLKHPKKTTSELSTTDAKPDNEAFEQISKEWKHVGLLLTSFFNCAREELVNSEIHNGSTERVDNSLERIRCSTPEIEQKDKAVLQVVTPKNTNKRGRTAKRPRSKTVQSPGSNGLTKSSPVVEAEMEVAVATPTSTRKRKSSSETPSRQSSNSKDSLSDTSDELIGKEVFAKWSDNKYYPGTVIAKTKTKFKVNFYDGQTKLIIEDFIVPMPATLQVGLSVYATSTDDDYGSCGIIIDAKRVKNNVIYTVQTDEQDEIRVQIKNIFLTNDQVQVLREETKVELKSPPSTPKHLGKVTLDNVVEGTRRSKRITTPVVLTPKAKRVRGSLAEKTAADTSKPSTSGILSKMEINESYDTMSDSNCSAVEAETDMLGVHPEITGTPIEQETKGPASRLKGKSRGRKRVEDPELVAKLGPIPPANSKIFDGMSFLLTCASLESIDRFQTDTKDSNSEPGTENEEEWTQKPFVRERLIAQLTAGGGNLYENFEQIPPDQYEKTKLITNVPNLTKKSLQCLSVGIKAYNHQWIIRCCQENKIVNPSEEELPAGWSIMKQSYVEMFQRRNIKPFQTLPVIVVIPLIPGEKDFVTFWTQICQNAGGAVLLPENPDDDFIEGTVVLTNKRCPSWVIEKAKSWSIPLVSTTWVIQSLIEGNICTYDAHPSFDYNYVKRQLSHISNLKRLH